VPELVGIAHMVLRVHDWRRTTSWYQDVLGFERRKGDGFSTFVHPSGSPVLLFRPTEEEPPASSEPTQRLDHIALHVPDLPALEAWQVELATKGIETEIDHAGFGSSITVFDPDGLEVELFTPATGSVMDVVAHR
jgi:catechol 2,3-dioxygenase-like lactoylglutathione lyase family enzyme